MSEPINPPLKNHTWTPLHLELMLHYYTSPEPFPRENSVIIDYRNLLIHDGLISSYELSNLQLRYTITEKGKCFVDMICDTPLPVPKETWVDPRSIK